MAASTYPVLALAGFASLVSMRLCDAQLPALAEAFSTSTTGASTVISSFAVVYGAMQLVYGPLGDRYGKQRVMAFASTWCALAALMAALAPSLRSLVIARAAMGGGAAALVPLAIAWISDRVPFAERQGVLARYSGATTSGIIVGAWAGGTIAQYVGWRASFGLMAPLFVLVAASLFRQCRLEAGQHQRPHSSHWSQFRELAQLRWARQVMFVAFAEGLFVFGSLAFVPSVLRSRFSLSMAQGGSFWLCLHVADWVTVAFLGSPFAVLHHMSSQQLARPS